MKRFALNALVSLFIAAGAIAAYHHLVSSRTGRIGVLDLAEVYRLKEKQFADRMTAPGATEADRDRAIADAQAFARALPQALTALPRECGCLVLLRTAVAGGTPAMVDLTPALKHRVGL